MAVVERTRGRARFLQGAEALVRKTAVAGDENTCEERQTRPVFGWGGFGVFIWVGLGWARLGWVLLAINLSTNHSIPSTVPSHAATPSHATPPTLTPNDHSMSPRQSFHPGIPSRDPLVSLQPFHRTINSQPSSPDAGYSRGSSLEYSIGPLHPTQEMTYDLNVEVRQPDGVGMPRTACKTLNAMEF